MSPQRVRLSRAKGYRKPDGAIVVARPSKWSNPFKAGERVARGDWRFDHYVRDMRLSGVEDLDGFIALTISDVARIVTIYERWLGEQPSLMLSLDELHGRDLACWCPLDRPCHADALLNLANPPLATDSGLVLRDP
jgi:hypothetical protein